VHYGENEEIRQSINDCIHSVKTECPEDYAASDLRRSVESSFGSNSCGITVVDGDEKEKEEEMKEKEVIEEMKEKDEASDSVEEEEMNSECIHCEAEQQCPRSLERKSKDRKEDSFRTATSKQHGLSLVCQSVADWCIDCGTASRRESSEFDDGINTKPLSPNATNWGHFLFVYLRTFSSIIYR